NRNGTVRPEIAQLVVEMQDQQLARFEPQRRRKLAVGRQVAIPSRAIGLLLVANRKVDLEHTTAASQLLRFWNRAAGSGPPTETCRLIKIRRGMEFRGGRGTGSEANRQEADSRQPLFHAHSYDRASPHR